MATETSKQYSIRDIKSKLAWDYSLTEAITEEISWEDIEDPKLASLWMRAETILEELQTYLDNH